MKRIQILLNSAIKDTLLEINSHEYVSLSTVEKLSDKTFLTQLKQQSKTDRVNFYSQDLKQLLEHFDEPSCDTYSWYICVRPQASNNVHSPVGLDGGLTVERMPHSEVSDVDRNLIIEHWERQYVEAIQTSRSPEQKSDLLASIATTLSEGTHLLYRNHNQLIGHGAFVEDFNEVIELPNLYVHLWTHQCEPLEHRRRILAHYFASLQSEKKCLSAGIAVNNRKSLRVFSSNGFEPAILSMGVYK